jgi:tetratricopeptide (TPR) repeat protein
MSDHEVPRYKKLWLKAGYSIIADAIKTKLTAALDDESEQEDIRSLRFLRYRLGINYYYAGRYAEALEQFEFIKYRLTRPHSRQGARASTRRRSTRKKSISQTRRASLRASSRRSSGHLPAPSTILAQSGDPIPPSQVEDLSKPLASPAQNEPEIALEPNPDYRVHMYAGRCCLRLFHSNHLHYHLEHGYQYYTNAINTIKVDLSIVWQLPGLLFEFGRILEYYGAFESAIEIYHQLLTVFPHTRKYFDALYRNTIISKHLTELSPASAEKEKHIDEMIDVMSLLLEALPVTINDVDAILLYLRVLSLSSKASMRFKVFAAYQNLFAFCQLHKPPIARAEKYISYKNWIDESLTWFAFGDMQRHRNEPLLARDSYEIGYKKLSLSKDSFEDGVDRSKYLRDTFLNIAKNCASFQDFEASVRYGELALKFNYLDKDVRRCLSKWSTQYAVKFAQENRGVGKIISKWRQRVWTPGYMGKIREHKIHDLETQVVTKRYDMELRKKLAYYGKHKWRAQFLFETQCAIRIQRKFRELRKIWKWQEGQRAHYVAKASEVSIMNERFEIRFFQ